MPKKSSIFADIGLDPKPARCAQRPLTVCSRATSVGDHEAALVELAMSWRDVSPTTADDADDDVIRCPTDNPEQLFTDV